MTQLSEARLRELLRAEAKLSALESAGVDNWSGYEDALTEIRQAQEQEEQIDGVIDGIIENSFDFFDIEEPAGHGAGYAVHVKDREGLHNLLKTFAENYGAI